LNPKYKEKVCKELDRMFDAKVIVSIEEYDWISPTLVQPNKTSNIGIYVDLRSLSATCVHNFFPTPFTDEVLENFDGWKAYSFTDVFSGYHQV